MPLIDIILLIIFIATAVTGFRKGFIAQVGSLAAIVVAVIACRALGPTATGWVMPDGPDAEAGSSMSRIIASAMAYSGVYLVAYYAVILVVRLLKMVTHTLFLGPLDRIGGAAVNIIKWGLAVSLVLNLYLALWPDGKMLRSSTIAGGKPIEWVVALAPKALGILNHPSAPESTSTSTSTEGSPTTEI